MYEEGAKILRRNLFFSAHPGQKRDKKIKQKSGLSPDFCFMGIAFIHQNKSE
jgi:hypothetical protein